MSSSVPEIDASLARYLGTCIEALVKLLHTSDCQPTRMQAAAALCHLAGCLLLDGLSDPNSLAQQMIAAGALPLLHALSDSPHEEEPMQLACVTALEALSRCLTPQSRRIYDRRISDPVLERRAMRGRKPRSNLGVGAPRSPNSIYTSPREWPTGQAPPAC